MPNEIPQIPVSDLPVASSTSGITLLVIQNGVCKRLTLDAVEDEIAEGLPNIPSGSDANPLMNDIVSAGSSSNWSRADHVHPKDTSKQDVLTFDASPQSGSDNPVKSKGIYNAIRSRRVSVQQLCQDGSHAILSPDTPKSIPLSNTWEAYDFLLCYFGGGDVYAALCIPTYSFRVAYSNQWWPVAIGPGITSVKIEITNSPTTVNFYGYELSPPGSGGGGIWVHEIYGIV